MYEIYCKLRDERGCKDADVARETGITKSTFTDWKNGRSSPKQDKLQKIANFFGVSLDYLRTGVIPEENIILTKKDERDIANDLEAALNKLSGDSALMFDGEPLDDETRELLRASLANQFRMAKIIAKQKYTPKKYRKESKE